MAVSQFFERHRVIKEGANRLDELTFLTAKELASIIRQHRASSQEVLEAHLNHIATHNPSLNA
jgi:hypothetical protein